jgi:hypothetical protein
VTFDLTSYSHSPLANEAEAPDAGSASDSVAQTHVATSARDLAMLMQQGEGTTLEYKESLSDSFTREVVAMANTRGGKILLGVRHNGTISGVGDSNSLRARIQDMARNCDPPVLIRIEPVGRVMVVHVEESDEKPVQCREGFFSRQGAVTQKLSRDEIRDFFRSEGLVQFDTSLHPRFRYHASGRCRCRRPGTVGRPHLRAASTPQVPLKFPRKCSLR